MLVSSSDLLFPAKRGLYAVGAFNIHNLESLLAVVEAALEEKSPAIIAITPGAMRYGGLENLSKLARTAAKYVPIPFSIHLDHGEDFETVSRCIKAGFTSVMIDGSFLSFEDNVALTRRVVNFAHLRNVSVEAELGRLAGFEEKAVEEKEAVLTDPDAASDFVKLTGVDALAVAIGTSHGAYKFKGEPKLDFERLRCISEKIDVPLVLHGASSVPQHIIDKAQKYGGEFPGAKGIPDDHIRKAISFGITKINIDTDLRLAFTSAIREFLAEHPKEFDPRKILSPAKEAMKQIIKGKMRLFGSSGKA